MNQSNKIIWGALGVAAVLWLAAPFVALYPGFVYSHTATDCAETSNPPALAASAAERCAAFIAKQGQSGDLFGATTSIFSGLALFAVAFTLYADLAHRRRERKPLIACQFDSDHSLNFDKPTADAEPKSFYIRGKVSISSVAETAINVIIHPTLDVNSVRQSLAPIYVGIPMEGSRAYAFDVSDVLSKSIIDAICENSQKLAPISLHFATICSNLDGERFRSEVTYKISLRFPDNLGKIMSMRHAGTGIDGAWDDRSAVPLDSKLEPNSWKFSLLAS